MISIVRTQADIDQVLTVAKEMIKNDNITGYIVYNYYTSSTIVINKGTSPGIKTPGDVFFMLELSVMTSYTELPVPHLTTLVSNIVIYLFSGIEYRAEFVLKCVNEPPKPIEICA